MAYNHGLVHQACRRYLLEEDNDNGLYYQVAKVTDIEITNDGKIKKSGVETFDWEQVGGIFPGMEAATSGFSIDENNRTGIVNVENSLLTLGDILLGGGSSFVQEAATRNASISVKLPSDRAWATTWVRRQAGRPYVTDIFIPGPYEQIGLGPRGTVVATPMYGLYFHMPESPGSEPTEVEGEPGDRGDDPTLYSVEGHTVAALHRYTHAMIKRFPPRTAFTYTDPDETEPVTVRVRSDTGPFVGQHRSHIPQGWVTALVTIPLRIYTQNAI